MKANCLGRIHCLRITLSILAIIYNLSACTSRVPRFNSVAVLVPDQLYDIFEGGDYNSALNTLEGIQLSADDRAYIKAAVYFFLSPIELNDDKNKALLKLGRDSLDIACSHKHPLSLALKGYGVRNSKFGYKYDSIKVEIIWRQYIAACQEKVEKSTLIPWRIISAN